MAGIYIHIPFCKQKCHYCGFHFSTTFEAYRSRMIDSLMQELQLPNPIQQEEIDTLYFGGGTPSILSEEELQSILQVVHQEYKLSPSVEITLEANPDDITHQKLNAWKNIGINRLSIGVQSFQQDDLILMNRAHNEDQALNAIKLSQSVGFKNISVDLMFGLPSLTDEQWKENIQNLIDLNIPHISAYNLTLEEQSALPKMIELGKSQPLDENKNARQFELLMATLSNHGFEQYEISNFSIPGYRSWHNSAYWENKSFLGIGPSAHSYYEGSRWHNISHNMNYIKSLETNRFTREKEVLSASAAFNEYILVRLRTLDGINETTLASKFPKAHQHFIQIANKQIREGNMWLIDNHYRLSQAGKFLADPIAMEFFLDED